MEKLNGDWVKYNNLHNEGGEGYNPHKKYITSVVLREPKKETAPLEIGQVELKGKIYSVDQIEAAIARADAARAYTASAEMYSAMESSKRRWV